MKKTFILLCLCLLSAPAFTQAEFVLNEINPALQQIEIKNIGNVGDDASGLWLCNFPDYVQLGSSTLISGNYFLAPNDILVVQVPGSFVFNSFDSEMGLYTSTAFNDPLALIDYVEWGSTGHVRSSVATAAGIWPLGDFHPAFDPFESLLYDGDGDTSSDWSAGPPSLGFDNVADVCDIFVGDIELSTGGTSTSICVDGIADPLSVITSGGTNGVNTGWFITDANDNILAIPPGGPFDLDGAGPGTCFIWYIRYEDGLTGGFVGSNLANLEGCFALSNGIEVIREVPDGGTVELANGGTKSGWGYPRNQF